MATAPLYDDLPRPLVLPPTLAGTESKNDFSEPPRLARDTQWVRATSLNVLRACPEQFHSKFLLSLPQPRPRPGSLDYGWIGTMAHDVIEHYLMSDWEIHHPFAGEVQRSLLDGGMPEREVVRLGAYLQRIRPLRGRVAVIEYEFDLELAPGCPRVRGHIDLIAEQEHGSVLIVDHKTNRTPKTLDKWVDDLQTMCYSWAVRSMVPDRHIRFRVGYINLGYDVEWEPHPSFDGQLASWFERAWAEVLRYEDEGLGRFPARTCDTCKYCPRSGDCAAERRTKASNKRLLASTKRLLEGRPRS